MVVVVGAAVVDVLVVVLVVVLAVALGVAAAVVVVVVVVVAVAPAALRHNPVQGAMAAPPEAWSLKVHRFLPSVQMQPFGAELLETFLSLNAYPLADAARPHSS